MDYEVGSSSGSEVEEEEGEEEGVAALRRRRRWRDRGQWLWLRRKRYIHTCFFTRHATTSHPQSEACSIIHGPYIDKLLRGQLCSINVRTGTLGCSVSLTLARPCAVKNWYLKSVMSMISILQGSFYFVV